jgi:NAD(P)-dependent dehydrogenase (short-subunit alcohol dehydrogenase family)
MKRQRTGRMTGRLALVTGASRGIGFEIARELAARGCNLVITARDAKSLNAAATKLEKLNIRVIAQSCDVRSPESVDYLFAVMRALHRPLDILINNAGIGHPARNVSELPYPTWSDVIDTNLTGMFLVTQAALAIMKQGSVIVNNLSIAAERVFAGSAAYNASKHGALGFTDTLREELRQKEIRVVGLMPGAADTDIWKTLWPKAPRRKMMSAETVAKAVVDAMLLPENCTVEKLVIMPAGGTL